MYNLPLPASLANLHRKTDQEVLMTLLPVILDLSTGFTPEVLLQKALERHLFPDLDQTRIFWKIRGAIASFQKAGYLERTFRAWYVPNIPLIQSECEAAAQAMNDMLLQVRQQGRTLAEVRDKGRNLMQAALLGPSGSPETAAMPVKVGSKLQASTGLKALAAKGKKSQA